MKIPIGQACKITLEFDFHPLIHPDDAAGAMRALFLRTAKSRKKATPELILEDLFLASLANKRPWSEWQVKEIEKLSASSDFCERFARALEKGRARLFDPINVFILSNWRTLTDPAFAKKLPGLEDWNPRAACGLIEYAGLTEECGEERYVSRRKRLGLSGKPVYRVRDSVRRADGRFEVDYD